MYNRWSDEMPSEVELCAVELPGHGFRFGEQPALDLVSLTTELIGSLSSQLDRPYAFFGHSLGGLLSFELTHQLQQSGHPLPEYLLLSASRAPQLPPPGRHTHTLPDRELVNAIAGLGGVPSRIAGDIEALEFMLPALRADLAMFETYYYRSRPALPVPFCVFGGTDDEIVGLNELEPWLELTELGMSLNLIEGDHFSLVKSEKTKLVALLARELRDWLNARR
jgi:medium-chain acyl-[acyl-carrier-protein] hydrolase